MLKKLLFSLHRCLKLQKLLHLNPKLDIQHWKSSGKFMCRPPSFPQLLCHIQHLLAAAVLSYSNRWHCFTGTVQKLYLHPYKPWAEWYSFTTEKSELTTEKHYVLFLWTSVIEKIFKSHKRDYPMWTNKCWSCWAGFHSTLLSPTPH